MTAASAGIYQVTAKLNIDTQFANFSGFEICLRKNGATNVACTKTANTDSTGGSQAVVTTLLSLSAGDYVEVTAARNANGSSFLTVQFENGAPEFSMYRVSG